jgi:hypothetical protein
VLDDLSALASAEVLGELLAVYWPATRFAVFVGWSLLALLPFVFLSGVHPVATVLVAGAIFWPFAARGLVGNPVLFRSAGERRIYLYERGFVYAHARGELELFRWDRIHTVFERIFDLRVPFKFVRPRIRLLVTRADGRTIALTNAWTGIEHLVAQASGRATRAQLPVARAALERGQGVRFGKLVVDAAGVTGPRRSAPWAEIELQHLATGRIRLLAADSLAPLFSTPLRRIPNLALFLAIARIYEQQDMPSQ